MYDQDTNSILKEKLTWTVNLPESRVITDTLKKVKHSFVTFVSERSCYSRCKSKMESCSVKDLTTVSSVLFKVNLKVIYWAKTKDSELAEQHSLGITVFIP